MNAGCCTCRRSFSSTERIPDQHDVPRLDLRAKSSQIWVSSRGPSPMQQASGMPCTFPLGLLSRRVHVRMRVDPDQTELLFLRLRNAETPETVPTATE